MDHPLLRSRAVRASLLLLAVAAVLAAVLLFWNTERRADAIAAGARALDTRLATAVRQTFDLRTAQQAYVSEGQDAGFWAAKVTSAASALSDSLTQLKAASTAGSSRAALEGALQALQEFERMDARARDYVETGQKLLAADLIFSDGLETTEEIVTALEQTRFVETNDAAAALQAGRSRQLTFAAAGGFVALAVLILLTPAPRDTNVPAASHPVENTRTTARAAVAQPARKKTGAPGDRHHDIEEFEFRPLIKPASQPAAPQQPRTEPPPAAETGAPALAATPAAAVQPAADLRPRLETVADVCKELARLADTNALPALLERASVALDASGVMLWVADPEARELTAIAAHGYPANILSRIGTIPRDAENVTAAAFRTGLLQTLKPASEASGAIAAPLVNPSGCIGVMSAEVRGNGEKESARLALATIVAAQLATLVAPAARSTEKLRTPAV